MLAIIAKVGLSSAGNALDRKNAILGSILAKAFTGFDGGGGGPCGGPIGSPPWLFGGGSGWLPPLLPPRHCAKALSCVKLNVMFTKFVVLKPPMLVVMLLGLKPDEFDWSKIRK